MPAVATLEFWLSAKAGPDGAAASELFEAEAMPHLNDLFRTAFHLLGDRSQAEDVLQDVYFQAWKSFSRFAAGSNCRAWLFGILFNCVRHYRRKLFRFPLLRPSEEIQEANLPSTPPIADQLSDRDILAALDSIPKDFREAVLLVDVEEFSYKEVAEILSIPIGTVMSRLSRGRKLLRDRLSQVARTYGIASPAAAKED